MKKSKLMLMSGLMVGALLSVSHLAGAAEYSTSVKAVESEFNHMTGWNDFKTDVAFGKDRYEAAMRAGGAGAVRTALRDAYAAWSHEPSGAAALAPHMRGAVIAHGVAADTAAAVVGDVDTLAALGQHHKPGLVGAMSAHDAVATAGAVVGDGGTLAALGQHHKPGLVGAMSAHDPVATAGAVVGDAALRGAVGDSITGTPAHRGEIAGKFAAANQVDEMRAAVIGHAASHAATAVAIRGNDNMRNAVIADLQANGYVLRQFKFRELITGTHPTANGGQGDGLWRDIRSNDHDAAKAKIRALGGIAPADGSMPV